MVKVEIGLKHLKDTRSRCGTAAQIPIEFAQQLLLQISLCKSFLYPSALLYVLAHALVSLYVSLFATKLNIFSLTKGACIGHSKKECYKSLKARGSENLQISVCSVQLSRKWRPSNRQSRGFTYFFDFLIYGLLHSNLRHECISQMHRCHIPSVFCIMDHTSISSLTTMSQMCFIPQVGNHDGIFATLYLGMANSQWSV